MTSIKKILFVLITLCLCFLLFNSGNFLYAQETPVQIKAFSIEKGKETRIEFNDNKGSLYFPANSVGKDFTLTVEKVKLENTKGRFNLRGDSYDFGPHGSVFDKPVQITLPYEVKEGQREDLIHLYYYNREKNRFEILPKVSQDFENKTVTGTIPHFSTVVPGVGSFTVEEGLSPNSGYFKNNNEFVDQHRGILYIERTDISIPGRGIDFNLKSTFSSDGFFNHYEEPDWAFSDFHENNPIYQIAKGWRYKLPFLIDLESEEDDCDLRFSSGSGTVYDLTSALCTPGYQITRDNPHDLEGYRYYDDEFADGSSYPPIYQYTYTRVIEIIREKIVVVCTISFVQEYNNLRYIHLSDAYALMPDGTVVLFNDPDDFTDEDRRGKVSTIYDTANKNHIDFNYYVDGHINYITDTIGRRFNFNYFDDRLEIVYSPDGEDPFTNLVRYEIDESSNHLDKFRRWFGEWDIEYDTEYTYDTTNWDITIDYPSGGRSFYQFNEYYSHYVIQPPGWKKKPRVEYHLLKESPTAPSAETKREDYVYYRKEGSSYYSLLYQPDNGDDTKVIQVTYVKKPASGDYINKIWTFFDYDEDDWLKGQAKTVNWTWGGSDWDIENIAINTFTTEIFSEYYEITETRYFFNPSNENDTTDETEAAYYVFNMYDDFGQQVLQEVKEENGATDTLLSKSCTVYNYSEGDGNPFPTPAAYSYPTSTPTPPPYHQRFNVVLAELVQQENDFTSQETYFVYDSIKNISTIYKLKDDSSGDVFIKTSFTYDSTYNNLESITDPKEKTMYLEYDSTYDAFISRDVRQITPPMQLEPSLSSDLIVHEFEYDDRGRLTSKRSRMGDISGTGIDYTLNFTGYDDYTSDYTNYTYDLLNRVTFVKTSATTSGGDVISSYTYDDTNNKLTIADALGNKTEKIYDGLDRLEWQKGYKPDGSSGYTQVSYKENEYHPVFQGNVVKQKVQTETTPAAAYFYTKTTLDKLGRTIEVSTSVNDTTYDKIKEISYIDDNGTKENCVIEKYYRTGSIYTKLETYKDWVGNIITRKSWPQTNGGGTAIETSYEYNLAGQLDTMTNAEDEEFAYSYDQLGRLTTTTYDDSDTEITVYNDNGNVETFTDRIGNDIVNTYNSINQLIEVETKNTGDTVIATKKYVYNHFNSPIKAVNYSGIGTTDAYRDCQYEYDYDDKGRVTQLDQIIGDDRKQYRITYSYEANGAVSIDTSILYEAVGDEYIIIKGVDYDTIDTDTQDDYNGISMGVYENSGTKGSKLLTLLYKYWGGLGTIKYGSYSSPINTTEYGYNSHLQPNSIESTKSTAGDRMDLSYTYDWQGNVTSWTIDKKATYYSYDGMDRLKKEDDDEYFTDSDIIYYYDNIGNRKGINRSADDSDDDYTDSGDTEYFYEYDAYNTMYLSKSENGTTVEWDYTYDDNGNITQKDNSQGDDDEFWFYDYNEQNQLVKVILSDDSTKGDGDDITKAEYTYDAAGMRIRKIEDSKTTIYIYSGQDILFEERFNTTVQDELDNSTYYESREYNILAGRKNLAKYTGTYSSGWSYSLEYHLLDHLGSRQIVIDSNGTGLIETEYSTYGMMNMIKDPHLGDVNDDGNIDIVDSLLISQYWADLDPSPFLVERADVNYDGNVDLVDALLVSQYYNDIINVLPPPGTEIPESMLATYKDYNFTGKKGDPEVNLVYFNARYYDAGIGRFITMDPIKSGGNWYVYCRNNPLKYFDPNGLDTIIFSEGNGYDFGTFAFQHQGIAVGNENIGYVFFETRPIGLAGDTLQEGMVLGLAGPIADIYGRSFATMKALKDFIRTTKFDKCIPIITSPEADLLMIATGLDSPNWFGIFTGINNCSHLVRGILQQGGVSLPSSDMDTAFQFFWLSVLNNADIMDILTWYYSGQGGPPDTSDPAGWINGTMYFDGDRIWYFNPNANPYENGDGSPT